MTNYKIKWGLSHTCSYARSGDILLAEAGLNKLTDSEQIEFLGDILLHEHIHKVLHELFDITTCRLYDSVEHYFRQFPGIQIKSIGNNMIVESYQSYINRLGFQAFLDWYHIDNDNFNQAFILCSSR